MESRMEKLSDSAYFVVDILSMCQTVLPYDPITAQQSMVVTVTYGEIPPIAPVTPQPAPQPGEQEVQSPVPPEESGQLVLSG